MMAVAIRDRTDKVESCGRYPDSRWRKAAIVKVDPVQLFTLVPQCSLRQRSEAILSSSQAPSWTLDRTNYRSPHSTLDQDSSKGGVQGATTCI